MKSNLSKSLRRHNKLNHAGINGVLHLGNCPTKTRSKKALLKDDQLEPFKVTLEQYWSNHERTEKA
jgi:hypothetical protein